MDRWENRCSAAGNFGLGEIGRTALVVATRLGNGCFCWGPDKHTWFGKQANVGTLRVRRSRCTPYSRRQQRRAVRTTAVPVPNGRLSSPVRSNETGHCRAAMFSIPAAARRQRRVAVLEEQRQQKRQEQNHDQRTCCLPRHSFVTFELWLPRCA